MNKINNYSTNNYLVCQLIEMKVVDNDNYSRRENCYNINNQFIKRNNCSSIIGNYVQHHADNIIHQINIITISKVLSYNIIITYISKTNWNDEQLNILNTCLPLIVYNAFIHSLI